MLLNNFIEKKNSQTYFIQIYRTLRSSCRKVVYKNGVLKSFDKFTGKHLSWSIFFNNVGGLRPGTLFKRLQHRFFSGSFVKLYRTLSVAACERLFFRTDLLLAALVKVSKCLKCRSNHLAVSSKQRVF